MAKVENNMLITIVWQLSSHFIVLFNTDVHPLLDPQFINNAIFDIICSLCAM